MNNNTRRDFVKKSGATLLAGTLGFNIVKASPYKHIINADTLKVGLIGCGGRGTGAALQATMSEDNVVLTAMADIFPDQIETSLKNLIVENPSKMMVEEDHKFVGFDAYKKLLASDVDVVLLATPPNFRPAQLAAAIEAGKHVFCEKPVAVDGPGIRSVLATAKKAKEKGLALMSGFCWRHDTPKIDTYNHMMGGEIGDMHTVYTTYNTGALWFKEPKKQIWTDTEATMRNWLYYNYLSGDHIVEQAIHSIDLMSWAMGDVMPISAVGTGGRQSRTEEKYGNVFDHFSIIYDYGEGRRGFHICRQQEDCSRAYTVDAMGSHGRAHIDVFRKHYVKGKSGEWNWEGDKSNMYQNEHNTLFKSIRDGNPYNDGERMSNSTMLAIWGRMVAYTGKELTWEEALNSEEVLGPKIDEFNWKLNWPLKPVAQPGKTQFV
jgi:predicted dehydrogenase